MASLWKHPQSKYLVACFTDRAGRRRKRSTKETDRKKAQRIADAFEEAARRLRTAKQVREVIAELHEEITGEGLPSVSTRDFFKQWLAKKEPEVARGTLDFYKQTTTKFITFLGEEADKGIELITADHVLRFRNEQARIISAKTVNHNIKCLRMLFKAAKRDGLVPENPAEFVDPVRERSEGKSRAFQLTELASLMETADNEWKSLIRFAIYTGQRLGDLALLTWRNVDLDKDEVRFVTQKTGRRISIPMASRLREHVDGLKGSHDPDAAVHPRAHAVMSSNGRVGPLSKAFAELLVAAGLRELKVDHESQTEKRTSRKRERYPLSFHSLRATATTLLHEAGIPASVAQELIGHDSETVHQGYVRVGREALEKAAAAFPTI
jgi:integrase